MRTSIRFFLYQATMGFACLGLLFTAAPYARAQVSYQITSFTVSAGPNPDTTAQTVTFSATITGNVGTPTGTVGFFLSNADDCSTYQYSAGNAQLSGGQASITASNLPYGFEFVCATYNGNGLYPAKTTNPSPEVIETFGATLNISAPASALQNQPVTFTATVSTADGAPAATGTVTLYDESANTTYGPVTLTNGVANIVDTGLLQGNDYYYAIYSGDSNYSAQYSGGGNIFVQAGLLAVSPGAIVAGSPDTTVTITGDGFTSSSVAQLTLAQTNYNLATTYVSPTKLQAVVPAVYLGFARPEPLQVQTGAAITNTLQLTVYNQYTDQVTVTGAPASLALGQTGQFSLSAGVTRGAAADAAVPAGAVTFTLGGVALQGSGQLSEIATPGIYQPGSAVGMDNEAGKLLSADFNGDGYADTLGVPSYSENYLQLFLSTGANALQTEEEVFAGCTVADFAVGDLDGDGIPDIVVACSNAPTDPYAFYLRGNGDGTFQAPAAIATSDNSDISDPSQIAVGDFNGDGSLDVALIDESGNLQIFTGSHPFTGFTAQTATTFSLAGGAPVNLVAADFNQDGKSDLALFEYNYTYNGGGGGTVLVLTSTANGFTTQQQSFTSPAYGSEGLAVTDLNGDGYPDVVVADNGEPDNDNDSGQVLIYENDGTGTLNAAVAYAAPNALSVVGRPFPVTGKPASQSVPPWSLFYSSYNPDTYVVLLTALKRQSATSYTQVDSYSVPNAGYLPYCDCDGPPFLPMAVGDANGDGYQDLFVNTNSINDSNVPQIVPVYYGNDAAVTLAAPIPALNAGTYNLVASYPGDIDFAGGTSAGYQITVSQATPSGSLTAPSTAVYGQAVNLSATLTGVEGAAQPTGTVQFRVDGVAVGAAGTVAAGAASSSIPAGGITAGSHTISAVYSGDTNYTALTFGSATLQVSQATPTITWNTPAPIPFGTALSATQLDAVASTAGALVYTPPAGTVLAVGTHTLSVAFTPSDGTDYTTAMKTVSLQVTGAETTTTLTASSMSLTTGQVVTLTAATIRTGGTAVSTGSTTFYDGTMALGTVQVVGANPAEGFATGRAIFKTRLGPGSHVLKALFTGTEDLQASSSTATVTVSGTEASSIALTAAANANDAANYDFTATVSGFGHAAPSGTVHFTDETLGMSLGSEPVTMAAGQFNLIPAPAVPISESIFTAAQDLNNDGIPDLVIEYYSNDFTQINLAVSLGVGDGTFHAPTTYVLSATSGNDYYNTVVVTDLNQDGIPDIVATSVDADAIYVLTGNGDGTFHGPVSYSAGTEPEFMATGDVNGDGIPDLTVGAGDQIAVLLGNGDGTFGTATLIDNAGGGYGPVLLGVFTASGHLDAVVCNYYNQSVSFLAGNGDGTFQAPTPLGVGANPSSIVAGDWNGDGKLDLAVTNQSGATVSVLEGNGDGTFQTQVSYPVGNAPTSVVTADVNGDGLPDLLVANDNSGTISVLLGEADGDFQAQTAIPVTSSNFLAVSDFNGDGVPDLADAGQSLTIVLGGTALSTVLPNAAIPGTGSHTIQAAYVPAENSIYSASTQTVVVTANGTKLLPVITWNAPASIVYGTALSAAQLDATASAAGTFVYTPAAGAVLGGGAQTLAVTFTPTDAADYSVAMATVPLTVTPAASNITPGAKVVTAVYGQGETVKATVDGISGGAVPTGTVQFLVDGVSIATVPVVDGVATYSIPGTMLHPGTHPYTDIYNGDANYSPFTWGSGSIVISQATPVISWAPPAPISYGTALSAAQLDATATPAGGTFVYTPPAGTVLSPGTQTLSVIYTATDTTDYTTATASVPITVTSTPLELTSMTPSIAYLGASDTTIVLTGSGFVPGSAAQLNGTALATSYVSQTELQAVIPASFLVKVQSGTITVTNPGGGTTAGLTFTVTPGPVEVNLSGPGTVQPGTQPTIGFQLGSAYPVEIAGTFTLTVQPTTPGGLVDPAVQFSGGGSTLNFTLAPNTTVTPPVQLQAGTLSGTITVTLTLEAGGVDVTPPSLQPVVIQVPPSAPTINSLTVSRDGTTLTVTIQGFSNTRDMKSATFQFTPASGASIVNPVVTVELEPSFATWYGEGASEQFGSSFTYVQTFLLSDDASTIGTVSGTLVNSVGDSNTKSNQ